MKQKSRSLRGISPLIAAVLLIGITMAVAIILSAWATQFTSDVTESVSTCHGAKIRAGSAKYDTSTGKFKVSVENVGSVPVDGFRLSVLFDNQDSGVYSVSPAGKTLSPDDFPAVFSNSSMAQNIDKVRVLTSCSGVYSDISRFEIDFS